MIRLFLAGLVLAAALPAEYAKAPNGEALTEEDYAALANGEILVVLEEIPDTPVKVATAVALVAAPPEQVFAVLSDRTEFPHFMPYCKKVEVKEKKGEWSRVRFELDFPPPIANRHYVLQLTDRIEEVSGTTVLTSRWTYEPGSGNINDTYGSWEVLPYEGNASFIRYTVFTDPGGKLPAWMRTMATKIAVPRVIKGLRKRVIELSEGGAEDGKGEVPDEK